MEGVESYEHYPSVSEFQELYSNSNICVFASQTSLLYQFPFDIFETSRYNKCRVGFIFDRITNTKNYVDQKSLIPKHFSFANQPLDMIAMLSMTGVSTIISTKWSLDYDETSEILEDMLDESISKGLNLVFALNKYKNPKRVLIKVEKPVIIEETKKKKDEEKKKKEDLTVLDETNSILVNKMEIFQYAPMIYGLNNVKLI